MNLTEVVNAWPAGSMSTPILYLLLKYVPCFERLLCGSEIEVSLCDTLQIGLVRNRWL